MFDFLVFGDVNVDLCTRNNLKIAFADLVENGVNIFEPIDELPGGSGFNFAFHAKKHGYSPLLVGVVGKDIYGDFLKLKAEETFGSMVQSSLFTSDHAPTGKAFIARDNRDIRLLVDNSPNANNQLNEENILSIRNQIEYCKNIYVSGYAIRKLEDGLNNSRINAIRKLFELIKNHTDKNIIFDVVPHKIYDMYLFDEFRDLTNPVNMIISEVPTIRRYLKLGNKQENVDETLARETASLLKNYYPNFILRWGPTGTDYELLWDGTREKIHKTNHQLLSIQNKRGFGDRLAVVALRDFFGIEHQKM